MGEIRLATALLLVFTVTACSSMQKPWGKGALGGAAIGAFAAGTGFGVAANDGAFGDADDETRGAAIAGGAITGAILGAVVGHILWDKEAPAPVRTARPTPPPAPKPPAAPLLVLTGANFEFGSAELTAKGKAALAGTTSSLKANPAVRIAVHGYTDSVGAEDYNLGLSKRRAEAVKAELVSGGVTGNRIETRGFGEASPIADNKTAAGRAANRRVEIHKLP